MARIDWESEEEPAPIQRVRCWVCGRFFSAPVLTKYDTLGKRCARCVAAERHFPKGWGERAKVAA